MKKFLTILLSLLVITGAFVFAAEVKAEAATVKLSKKKVTLEVGKSKKIKVKGTKTKAVWTTSDEKVATVKNGKITAKGEGTCKIVATVGTKKLTCKVTVNAKKGIDFDASVKLGDIKFPKLSTWEQANEKAVELDGGVLMMEFADYSDGVRSIIYETLPFSDYDSIELTEEDFGILGDYFANSFAATLGATVDKNEVVNESGKFYGKATGSMTSLGQNLPYVVSYKIEDGYFIATVVIEAGKSLSETADSIAFDACKAAKKAK